MKTFIRFLSIAAFISLLIACNESSQFTDDLSGMELKKAPVVPVFVVEPSGVDDTQALNEAFANAIAAGHGSVVQLTEGEYHLWFIEIHDFFGTFRGAGKDKTVITAMGNMNIQFFWDQNKCTDFIKFTGGDVQVSNLTIQTPPGRLSYGGPNTGHIRGLINFATYNGSYEPRNDTRSIHAVVDHVSLKGHTLAGAPGTTRGYNCIYAIHAGWDSYGLTDLPREKVNLTVTNSEFETFDYGVCMEGQKNSKITIGTKNKGNVFNDVDYGCGIYQFRDIEITVEGNQFNNRPGVTCGFDMHDGYDSYYPFFRAEPATKASICNVQFNEFNLPRSRYAVSLYNYRRITPGEIPHVFQVRNNRYNMTEGYSRAVYSSRTKGMVIRNNNFTGYGEYAIYLSTSSECGLVLGNNFSGAELKNAAVYLHSTTKDWAIVGGNIGDRVINLGTNNVITGMNVSDSDTSPGELISEDLPRINHIMH